MFNSIFEFPVNGFACSQFFLTSLNKGYMGLNNTLVVTVEKEHTEKKLQRMLSAVICNFNSRLLQRGIKMMQFSSVCVNLKATKFFLLNYENAVSFASNQNDFHPSHRT